jgi:hypothetical protein
MRMPILEDGLPVKWAGTVRKEKSTNHAEPLAPHRTIGDARRRRAIPFTFGESGRMTVASRGRHGRARTGPDLISWPTDRAADIRHKHAPN